MTKSREVRKRGLLKTNSQSAVEGALPESNRSCHTHTHTQSCAHASKHTRAHARMDACTQTHHTHTHKIWQQVPLHGLILSYARQSDPECNLYCASPTLTLNYIVERPASPWRRVCGGPSGKLADRRYSTFSTFSTELQLMMVPMSNLFCCKTMTPWKQNVTSKSKHKFT